MSGYSYFNYDQMTLLEIEVHSDELELLQQATSEYDWKTIQRAYIKVGGGLDMASKMR